jgi:hypothetical protein
VAWEANTNSICATREIKRSAVRKAVHTMRGAVWTPGMSEKRPREKYLLQQTVHKKSTVHPQFFHSTKIRSSA